MAKQLLIEKGKNATKIVVDGHELADVISYWLDEDHESGVVLTLRIQVITDAEVRL